MAHLLRNVAFQRDKSNPVIHAEKGGAYGETITMNPWVVRQEDTYYLFHAADDATGRRTIRLCTASVDEPAKLTPHGIVVDHGEPGSFDGAWAVLPQVIRMPNGLWHMYYTGNCGVGKGLSSFPGIGLATSDDLIHWKKYEGNPVLPVEREKGEVGIANGSLLMDTAPDGTPQLRYYYTHCPTVGDDIFLDQQKEIHYAVSGDGIHWQKMGCLMKRDPAHDYENIAVAGPVVLKEEGLYRMWYSAIGTRWGFYSICYAESEDGIHWNRGENYGENLCMGPFDNDLKRTWHTPAFDCQMAEYPTLIREGEHLRMYYCGSGYGTDGIGTAASLPMRAVAENAQRGEVLLWKTGADGCQSAYVFDSFSDRCRFTCGAIHNADIFMEAHEEDRYCRALLMHEAHGITLRYTFTNTAQTPATGITIAPRLPEGFRLCWREAHENLTVQPGQTIAIHADVIG